MDYVLNTDSRDKFKAINEKTPDWNFLIMEAHQTPIGYLSCK
jgi:hypothetical protein